MASAYGIEFGVNANGKLYFQINGSIYVNTTGPTLVNGSCYHAAVTRSGNNFTFYVDGTSTGTFTTTETLSYNEADLFFGRSSYSDGYSAGQFIGLIEDIRIWSVARTQTQISTNRYVTLVGNESGLLGYWPINEGSGTIINDITGNNDGTLYGQTWTTLSCGSSREGQDIVEFKQSSDHLNVFPVPFDTETNILFYSANQDPISIVITDLLGTVVYNADGLNSNVSYSVGKYFASGIYTVAVRCGEKVEYRKIVKQ